MSKSIKKVFAPVYALLVAAAEEGKKVKSVLPELEALMAAKAGGGGGGATTFVKDDAGVVVAIFDYYHKKWVDPRIVEFGAKAGTATGLNTMSKEGTSNWTKQERAYKKGKDALLTRVVAGELDQAQLQIELAELEEARKVVVPLRGDYVGFDTAEEAIAFSEANPGFQRTLPEVEEAVASETEDK